MVRRTSALLAYGHGQELATIAVDLAVSEETVYAWLRAFVVAHGSALAYRTSSGRPDKLTPRQKQRLRLLLQEGPLAYGLTTGCWSSLLVQQLILNEFGVLYNRHYLCALLKDLGFSYQKAKFVSDHLDPVTRQQWLEQTWPSLLARVQAKNGLLLFVDEASFPQWGSRSYTWALRGHQPEVPTSGKRKAYKVFGAVEALTGRLFYQGLEGRFNSETYQQFLHHLMQQTAQHLFIIQDGARYHTSQSTQTLFHTHRRQLTGCQLPSYSPDFNPIEHLWQAVKKGATHNKYFPTLEAVIDSVETALRFLCRHRKQVRQLLGDHATAENLMPKAA
ncbi:MAG: IS630 family transposase [Candidatus Latescibacteria bacterium]|nr:IS630 family transposase [Candidatus Latescibacterota bacterium]